MDVTQHEGGSVWTPPIPRPPLPQRVSPPGGRRCDTRPTSPPRPHRRRPPTSEGSVPGRPGTVPGAPRREAGVKWKRHSSGSCIPWEWRQLELGGESCCPPRREGGHDPCICCTAQLCLLPRTPPASRSAPEDARTQGPGWEAQRPPRAATEDGIRSGSEGSPCWAAGCVFRDLGACSLAAALPQAASRLRRVQTTGFIGGFYRYRLHRGRTAPEGGGCEAAWGGLRGRAVRGGGYTGRLHGEAARGGRAGRGGRHRGPSSCTEGNMDRGPARPPQVKATPSHPKDTAPNPGVPRPPPGRRREPARARRERPQALDKTSVVHKTNSVHLGSGELDNILCTAPK